MAFAASTAAVPQQGISSLPEGNLFILLILYSLKSKKQSKSLRVTSIRNTGDIILKPGFTRGKNSSVKEIDNIINRLCVKFPILST